MSPIFHAVKLNSAKFEFDELPSENYPNALLLKNALRDIRRKTRAGENIGPRNWHALEQDLALVPQRAGFEALGGEDHRLASQDLGVNDDALRQRHTHSLPCP